MLPTHEHLADHHGYMIYLRKPGFEFTPMMLAKIASFIVRGPDDGIAVFAFMYSMLTAFDGNDTEEDRLLNGALQTIRTSIDDGKFDNRQELTFEYRNGSFQSVANPSWWIPTFETAKTGNE